MKVEFLGEDELLVELEIRGLVGPVGGVVTPELKEVLARRLRNERTGECWEYPEPKIQHEAALKHPEREVAICQQKLLTVQQFLLEGISTGKTVAEMAQWLMTKMEHIHRRILRRQQVTRIDSVLMVMDCLIKELLWRSCTPSDTAAKLARVVISIDQSMNEEAKELELIAEEELKNAEVELGNERGEDIEDIVEVEIGVEEDQKTNEGEAELHWSGERDEKGEYEVEIERAEEEEEKVDAIEVQGKIVPQEDMEVKVRETASRSTGGTCFSAKESSPVLIEWPNRDMDVCSSGADGTQPQRGNDTRAQVRVLICAYLTVQIRAWCGWFVARCKTPVNRLKQVLDLRLEDEVLAKANRRAVGRRI